MSGLDHVIDLEAVRQRLVTDLGQSARKVELLADIEAVMQARVIMVPAVYVVPGTERAQEMGSIALAQRVRASFGLLLLVRNAGDTQGGAVLGGGLRDLRSACLRSLQGWVMDEATGEPVAHQDGRVLRMAPGGYVMWVDAYAVTHYRGL